MKRFFTQIILLLLVYNVTKAQSGLEDIIVEKYYISGAKDTSANTIAGKLPVGSVTYRIYVDLLPGYKFQAAFGIPRHELKIETTTSFFNHKQGSMISNLIRYDSLYNNTIMLDSWLSVGAACEGNYGILKSEDDTIKTIKHRAPFLQNYNNETGVPLDKKDGIKVASAKLPRVTFFGIDTDAKIFENKTIGSKFATTNGSWACLNGAMGVDSLSNKILIAQLTTDGELSFELNLQIGTPYGGVEQYVARNPESGKILHESLIYNSSLNKKESKKRKNKFLK